MVGNNANKGSDIYKIASSVELESLSGKSLDRQVLSKVLGLLVSAIEITKSKL